MIDERTEKPFYSTLGGIRGIAATAVFIRHFSPFMASRFYHSYLAVDLFFMLSGFVLGTVYDGPLRTRTLSVYTFVKLRITRLYPLFFLGSLTGLIASLLTVTYWGSHLTSYAAWLPGTPVTSLTAAFLFSLLMLPSIFSATLFPLNGPAWTLFYEIIANGFYAFIRPYLSWRSLSFVVVLCGCGILACALIYRSIDVGFFWKDMPAGFTRTAYSFSMGLLLAEARKKSFVALWAQQNSFIAIGILVLVGSFLAMPSYAGFDPYYDLIAVFLLFPVLVLSATLYEAKVEYIKIFNVLGKTSYGVYILHVPFSALIAIIYSEMFRSKINPLYGAWALFPCLVASAFVLDRYYDWPTRRLLQSAIMPLMPSNKNARSNN